MNLKRPAKFIFFAAVIFLLSAGIGTAVVYVCGAETIKEYRYASTAPLFGGFVGLGAYGLFYTYQNRGGRGCLLGLLITVLCYVFMEGLFNAI